MGGIGGGSSKSSQQSTSKQESGLRGTAYEDNAAKQANDEGMRMSNLNTQLFSSPGATMDMGKQMYAGGKYGLGETADQGVEALGRYQFGLSSGESATRGQLRPENQSAVIGSSIQNMLPFLIPQMQQTQQNQFMAPQTLMASAKNSADYWNRALGAQGESQSTGSSSAWNAEAKVNGVAPGLA